MAIAYRSSATANNLSSNSVTINKPAGTVSGDVLIAFVTINVTGANVTPPTGWANKGSNTSGSISTYRLVLICGGSEPASYTFTFDQTAANGGVIGCYSGVDNSNPVNTSSGQSTSGSASITAPSATTSVANTLIVAGFAIGSGEFSMTGPGGSMTDRASITGNPSLLLSDQAQVAAGATGTFTATASSSAADNTGQLVVLQPPQAASLLAPPGFVFSRQLHPAEWLE